MTRTTETQKNQVICKYSTTRHIDGGMEVIDKTAQLTFRITGTDDYQKIKALIAKQQDTAVDVSITGLRFIGMEVDA